MLDICTGYPWSMSQWQPRLPSIPEAVGLEIVKWVVKVAQSRQQANMRVFAVVLTRLLVANSSQPVLILLTELQLQGS